jgi:hypothetical protein
MSSVVVNVCILGWQRGEKGDVGGQARGLKIGQLTLSNGPARAEVCFLVQRATIPNKRVLFTMVNNIHAFNIVYMHAMLCV